MFTRNISHELSKHPTQNTLHRCVLFTIAHNSSYLFVIIENKDVGTYYESTKQTRGGSVELKKPMTTLPYTWILCNMPQKDAIRWQKLNWLLAIGAVGDDLRYL